jgi:hypothetical protein
MEEEVVMGNYRQATLGMFATGLRTNKGMAQLLKSRFRVDKDLDDATLLDLLSDDVMASATRIGNETIAAARVSLMTFYGTLVDLRDDTFLQQHWRDMLRGKREMVKALQSIHRRLPLRTLGDFKLHFVYKCFRSVFPNIWLAPLVGSNLHDPGRGDVGALHQMFQDHINVSLLKQDLNLLMEKVLAEFAQELVLLGEPSLAAMLDVELLEHWLCEWKKAKRLEAQLRRQASKKPVAQPLLVRRNADPTTPR